MFEPSIPPKGGTKRGVALAVPNSAPQIVAHMHTGRLQTE